MPISPFVEFKTPPVSGTFVTGSDTHEIDHLRQGVEIRDIKMRLLGTLPKATAGTDDHQIPQTSFGQPKEFQDDTSYSDMTTLVPSAYVGTPGNIISYPLTHKNPSYSDISELDGVLEPLAIRSQASRNTVEWPFAAHRIRGLLSHGNNDGFDKSDIIVDEYEFSPPVNSNPYFDSDDAFGTSSSSSIRLPGISSDIERHVTPVGRLLAADLITDFATGSVNSLLLSASLGISGTHPHDPGYISPLHVSTIKGFEYQSARRGRGRYTDSIAFGDREEYAARGFLMQRDSIVQQYPTVLRTGDRDRLGNRPSAFNDTRTLIFTTGTMNIGRGLQKDSYYLSMNYMTSTYVRRPAGGSAYPFIGQRRIVSHSSYPIVTESHSATSRPGIGDEWILTSESNGPRFFDDSRVHLGYGIVGNPAYLDIFYGTGTAENEYPGFGSRLSSKTQVQIDLTPQREHYLYRISTDRINSLIGANTPEFTTGSTGFAYFNHSLRRWEDIGKTDPVTGRPLPYDYCVTVAPAGGSVNNFAATGTGNFPCQFAMSSQMAAAGTGASSFVDSIPQARAWGYDRIGAPTNTNFAPFATVYHATQSQALKMSNYIQHPFLLEKAVLKIAVVARKIHHPDTTGIRSDNDMRRDIDNYVFFAYRQTHISDPRFGKDSATDVSGSVRNLILSTSITFWNKPTIATGYSYSGGTTMTSDEMASWPLHNPGFAYNWNHGVNGAGAVHVSPTYDFVGIHTASLLIPIIPAVAVPAPAGASSFPAQQRVGGADVQRVVKFQNAWVGATSQQPFMEIGTGFTGKHGTSSSIGIFNPSIPGYYSAKYSEYDPGIGAPGFARAHLADGRSFRSVGGGIPRGASLDDTFAVYSVTGSVQSITAPYVLLPTDELVFGFDAGISQFRNGASLGLTGSFIKILPSECTLTLFGSLLREGGEYHNTRNQNLTSAAVHEAIYSDDIVDQFDVETRTSFSGSYIDSVITGTLSANGPTRGIVSSVTAPTYANQQRLTGSLFRGVAPVSTNERIYDTILPDLVRYASSTNRATITETGGIHYVSLDPYRYFVESGSYRMPFPYANTFTRNINPKPVVLYTTLGNTLSGSNVWSAFFKVGARGRLDSGGDSSANDHAIDGASGFRYGLYNINPIQTRAIFRYNRFGQFRDMLEQRLYTKFQGAAFPDLGIVAGTLGSPVSIKFAGNVPARTNSSNLSTEATSSLPYFDGIVTNREDPLNTGILNHSLVELL